MFLFNRIASTFEAMAARVSQLPETTAELVELTNYINESRDSTMFNLKTMLITTAENVMFLMNHAILQSKYILQCDKINTSNVIK